MGSFSKKQLVRIHKLCKNKIIYEGVSKWGVDIPVKIAIQSKVVKKYGNIFGDFLGPHNLLATNFFNWAESQRS